MIDIVGVVGTRGDGFHDTREHQGSFPQGSSDAIDQCGVFIHVHHTAFVTQVVAQLGPLLTIGLVDVALCDIHFFPLLSAAVLSALLVDYRYRDTKELQCWESEQCTK